MTAAIVLALALQVAAAPSKQEATETVRPKADTTTAPVTEAVRPKANTATAPVPVEVVFYSDFQCPFCAQFSGPFREFQKKGVEGAKVTVQFKHFPIASLHPAAQLAHQAALAAKAQGKFWEMHDLLFANQRQAQRADLLGYAK